MLFNMQYIDRYKHLLIRRTENQETVSSKKYPLDCEFSCIRVINIMRIYFFTYIRWNIEYLFWA